MARATFSLTSAVVGMTSVCNIPTSGIFSSDSAITVSKSLLLYRIFEQQKRHSDHAVILAALASQRILISIKMTQYGKLSWQLII